MTHNNISGIPETIYLNLGEDFPEDEVVKFNELHGVSWCEDDVHGNGIAYERKKPLIDQIKASLKPLEWKLTRWTTNVLRAVAFPFEYNVYPHLTAPEKWCAAQPGVECIGNDFDTINLAKEAAQNHYAEKVAELFNLTTE